MTLKIVKTMLVIALLWSSLMATILVCFHYAQTTLVVQIHWKDGDNILDPLSNEISIRSRRDLKSINTDLNSTIVYPKLKHLPVHTLESLNRNCSDPLCLEYLSNLERVYYDKCKQKAISMEYKFGPILKTGQCKFQNGSERYPVALASFPGSGNTWVRGLLEKVTGICTGALYCDCGLRTKGFTGEGIRGPSSLVIKAHSKSAIFTGNKIPRRILNDQPVYGGAILLVRDPRKALIAEWHRERSKRRTNSSISNHYLYVGKEYFGENEQWDRYVKEKSERWKSHVSGWIINGRYNPFHIVRYEDLKLNPTKEVLKMAAYLGFKDVISEMGIQARVGEGYNSFYRNHQDGFEHFTHQQEELIGTTINETIAMLAEYGLDHSFPIRDYL